MKLSDYLKKPGAAADLSRKTGIHPVLISQWKKGDRAIPAKHCPAIERATDGAVKCEELRPDISGWAYLRQQTN